MKKRSALTVAGGLVGALLSGIVGYSMRLTGVQAAGTTQAAPKPVVKTITTTVHVKKKPKVRARRRVAGAGLRRSLLVFVATGDLDGWIARRTTRATTTSEHEGGDD